MDANKKDTQLPIEFIPLIISHWWEEYYYGPGFTVAELREFLEDKLRTGFYSQQAVEAWIYRAVRWQALHNQHCPGYVDSILEEYTFQRRVA